MPRELPDHNDAGESVSFSQIGTLDLWGATVDGELAALVMYGPPMVLPLDEPIDGFEFITGGWQLVHASDLANVVDLVVPALEMVTEEEVPGVIDEAFNAAVDLILDRVPHAMPRCASAGRRRVRAARRYRS